MKAFLIRIGVDQAYGGWNAPVDPVTGDFVYVPIPESATDFHPECCRRLSEFRPALENFCGSHRLGGLHDLRCDLADFDQPIHLDPDFEHLTYGDDGSRRGAGVAGLAEDDLLVFYSGLRPISKCDHKLLYALVGVYVIREVMKIATIPANRWHENAHTRKLEHWKHDIVVRAKPERSGRLQKCLPIGEWRDGAYRVNNEVLTAWGGLSVRNGFIQRSAVPPAFIKPEKFYEWFQRQRPTLLGSNY